MALFPCPECGKEISETAVACPGCGAVVELPVCIYCQGTGRDQLAFFGGTCRPCKGTGRMRRSLHNRVPSPSNPSSNATPLPIDVAENARVFRKRAIFSFCYFGGMLLLGLV